jgi:rhodanese-related sulfurtransferase
MTRSIDFPKHLLGIAIILACFICWSNASKVVYDVKDVDVATAKAMVDAGALVVDVRGQSQYDSRHIPGAILVPLEELRAGIPAKIASIAKDRQMLVYCGDGVTHGPEGTHILNKAGFSGAVNLKPGIEGWAGAGQPVSKR